MSTCTNHSYDANGNTLSDAQGRSFTWDFENRLTQVVNPGVGTTTFRYDPFGRRIQKSGPLGTTNYLYDGINKGGANLIEEVDNAGNVLARYTQAKVIDEPLAMLRSGTTSYYQSDVLGSSTSLSTSTGGLANTYTYDSFGKLVTSTGTLANPFQYTAREFDPETGIYEYRTRYYDQNAGRFLSEDPLHFRATIDFYPYARNNPLLWRDPDGRGISWSGIVNSYYDAKAYLELLDCAVKTWGCLNRLSSTVVSIPLGGSPDDPNPTSDPEVNNIHSACHVDKDCKKLFCDCFFTFWSSVAMLPISPPSWLPFDPGGCKK